MRIVAIFTGVLCLFPVAAIGANLGRKLKEDDGPEVNPDECARTIPRIILDVLDLGEEWGTLLGQTDGAWDSICCTTSALRAEIGFLWTDTITGMEPCVPFLESGEFLPNFFGFTTEPITTTTTADPATTSGPVTVSPGTDTPAPGPATTRKNRNLKTMEEIQNEILNTDWKKLAPNDPVMKEKLLDVNAQAAAFFKPGTDFVKVINDFLGMLVKDQQSNEALFGQQETEDSGHRKLLGPDLEVATAFLTEQCADLIPVVSVLEIFINGPEFLLFIEFLFFACNYITDILALLTLFTFSPWLLPACHCNYRKMGCGVDSCYDSCSVDCETIYAPKPDLVSDVSIATNSYWRAQLYQVLEGAPIGPGLEVGSDFLGTLRACQACPGEQTYFEARLGGVGNIFDAVFDAIDTGDLDQDLLGSIDETEGLLPVRRGGKPFEQCLGYCYMYGVVEAENFFCQPIGGL